MDIDVSAVVFAAYAIIVAITVLPIVGFMLYLLQGGGVLEGGWVRRALVCVLWSLATMGAALADVADSLVVVGMLISFLLIGIAWKPLIEAWRLARETDRLAWRAACMRDHPAGSRRTTENQLNIEQLLRSLNDPSTVLHPGSRPSEWAK